MHQFVSSLPRRNARSSFNGDERESTSSINATGWLLIAIHVLTIIGVIWTGASQYGSLKTRLESVEVLGTRMVAAQENQTKANQETAKAISDLAVELGRMQGSLSTRTTTLEARAASNRTAIHRETVRQDQSAIRQEQSESQQSVDREAAAAADHRQSKRADQSDNRQDAAATNAATSQRIQTDQQDNDRKVRDSGNRLLTDRQENLRKQQDIDRAAAARAKKK